MLIVLESVSEECQNFLFRLISLKILNVYFEEKRATLFMSIF